MPEGPLGAVLDPIAKKRRGSLIPAPPSPSEAQTRRLGALLARSSPTKAWPTPRAWPTTR
eukprot:6497221-Pyramimonas_sp.AAC.1